MCQYTQCGTNCDKAVNYGWLDNTVFLYQYWAAGFPANKNNKAGYLQFGATPTGWVNTDAAATVLNQWCVRATLMTTAGSKLTC